MQIRGNPSLLTKEKTSCFFIPNLAAFLAIFRTKIDKKKSPPLFGIITKKVE